MSDSEAVVPPIRVIERLQARMQPEMRHGEAHDVTALPVMIKGERGSESVIMVPAMIEEVEGHLVFTMMPLSTAPGEQIVQTREDLEGWIGDYSA